jgi:S-adenosylmethionine decarboxylase
LNYFDNLVLLIPELLQQHLGTHIIASFITTNSALLIEYGSVKHLIQGLITQFDLKELGAVYHNFHPEGYTAVVCLSESHLSIHTWPEHNKVNLDVYLSNHLRSNDNTVQLIYEALKDFFSPVNVEQTILTR